MKHFFLGCLFFTLSFSDISTLKSFEADFTQTIADEKGETLTYIGSVKALQPQFALWVYETPVEKRVYIENERVVIVEPEIEQVIMRNINNDFDFFHLLKSAQKIKADLYVANFEDSRFYIKLKEDKIYSLSYKDKFDNSVNIVFSKQVQNGVISKDIFKATYPLDYDIIRD